MKEPKLKCPVAGCPKRCEGAHRLARHMKGNEKNTRQPLHPNWRSYRTEILRLIDDEEFVRLFEPLEPPETADDRIIASAKATNETWCASPSINSYLCGTQPLCREERQYAHFLAKKIEDEKEASLRPVTNKLGLSEETVQGVYYEATLMRDFWDGNRKAFNKLLCEYAENKKWPQFPDVKETIHPNKWCKSHPYVRWMMNAKPDIALLTLTKTREHKLYFLECKYLSRVDTYKAAGVDNMKQIQLQERILEFLCEKLRLTVQTDEHMTDSNVTAGDVILVQFTSPITKKHRIPKGVKCVEIPIKDIVPTN
jgi:hypothetical protein